MQTIPIALHRSDAHQPTSSGSAKPVTFGIPMPPGRFDVSGSVMLRDGAGRVAPAAGTTLEPWPDGSARWLLVDALLPPGFGAEAQVVLGPQVAQVFPPLVVEQAGRLTVKTGLLRLTMPPKGELVSFKLARDSDGTAAAVQATLTLSDEFGADVTPRVLSVAVEHENPIRCVIGLRGQVLLAGRDLEVTVRITCYAGLASAKVACTIRNPAAARHPDNYWDLGDQASVLLKDMSWRLELPAPITSCLVSDAPGNPVRSVSLPFELYQDSSGGENWRSPIHINRHREVPVAFQGYRASDGQQGLRATPFVGAASPEIAAAVTVPMFWQNFPQALAVDGSLVRVHLLAGQSVDLHELQGGEQKTYDWYLTVGDHATVMDAAESCRCAVVASVSPEWACQTGAISWLAPLSADHSALVNTAVEGPESFVEKRERVDQYGWRHFGDVYGDHEAVGHAGVEPLVSHYNNQYDPLAGFIYQFLRTGDPRWWHAMTELAAHVTDIDIYHTVKDKAAYNGGLFWHTYHYGTADTSTHRTYPRRNTGTVFGGGPSADHNYPTGLMLHYFLTGSAASHEAAIGLATYVLNLEDGRKSPFRWLSLADTGRSHFTPPNYFGPSRASGNSLNALVDGHRLTGDERFLARAEILIRRVVHPADDVSRRQLHEPEIRWFYTMFFQALGKYLAHRAERGLVDEEFAYARAALLHYARWMADHEYPWLEKPEKLEFPTETWAAQDIRKSDIFCHAAMNAEGAERERFIERAGFFYRTSYETLSSMPTHALARPVVVLLTSGFLPPWLERHPGARLPEGPHVAFGEPERFVPQRAIAEKRAKLIVAGGAVAAVAALAGLIRALW